MQSRFKHEPSDDRPVYSSAQNEEGDMEVGRIEFGPKSDASARPRKLKIAEGDVVPQGLPKQFFNSDGEVDLRQVTGNEAYAYFRAQGINLPIMPKR